MLGHALSQRTTRPVSTSTASLFCHTRFELTVCTSGHVACHPFIEARSSPLHLGECASALSEPPLNVEEAIQAAVSRLAVHPAVPSTFHPCEYGLSESERACFGVSRHLQAPASLPFFLTLHYEWFNDEGTAPKSSGDFFSPILDVRINDRSFRWLLVGCIDYQNYHFIANTFVGASELAQLDSMSSTRAYSRRSDCLPPLPGPQGIRLLYYRFDGSVAAHAEFRTQAQQQWASAVGAQVEVWSPDLPFAEQLHGSDELSEQRWRVTLDPFAWGNPAEAVSRGSKIWHTYYESGLARVGRYLSN